MLIRTTGGAWEPQPFLMDTMATLTHVPLDFADRADIPYSTARPLQTATIMGKKPRGGCLSPLTFALADLPQWAFETPACFSPDKSPGGFPLLSGSDVLERFDISLVGRPHPGYPHGYLMLQLRDDHDGTTRAPAE